MNQYKALFVNELDRNGIKWIDRDELVVEVKYNGRNMNTVDVFFFFEDDSPIAQACCMNIATFKGNESAGIAVCNKLNNGYRWVKFFIDRESYVVCQGDVFFNADVCGMVCRHILTRVVNIVDDAYPEIMKARWPS